MTAEVVDSRPDTYAHIDVVRSLLTECVEQLLERAMDHDRSKLESPERDMFDKYTPLLRDMTYGSEEYKQALKEMSETALQHHYDHNRHHPEFHANGIDDMNLVDLVEMICDWVAASRRHADGDPHRSIDINAERFGYGPQLARILHNTVSDVLYVD